MPNASSNRTPVCQRKWVLALQIWEQLGALWPPPVCSRHGVASCLLGVYSALRHHQSSSRENPTTSLRTPPCPCHPAMTYLTCPVQAGTVASGFADMGAAGYSVDWARLAAEASVGEAADLTQPGVLQRCINGACQGLSNSPFPGNPLAPCAVALHQVSHF